MNNIHEMDWADERWHGHTGMDSSSGYCFPGDEAEGAPTIDPSQQPSRKTLTNSNVMAAEQQGQGHAPQPVF